MSDVWKITVWPCCRYQAHGFHADDCADALYPHRRVPGCESWREPVSLLVGDIERVEDELIRLAERPIGLSAYEARGVVECLDVAVHRMGSRRWFARMLREAISQRLKRLESRTKLPPPSA